MRKPGARNRSRGVAAVEFALTLPVLIVFLLGLLETGRLIQVQHTLTAAAAMGAREAVLPTATATAVAGDVRAYIVGNGIAASTVTVAPEPTAAAPGTLITVTVSTNFADASWLGGVMYGTTVLQSKAVMKKDGG